MRFLFSTRQIPGRYGASGLRVARTPPLAGKRPAIGGGGGGGGAAFAGGEK